MAYLMSVTGDDHPREVINILSGAMNLLRKCRVNAALTIQVSYIVTFLFTVLFCKHYSFSFVLIRFNALLAFLPIVSLDIGQGVDKCDIEQ